MRRVIALALIVLTGLLLGTLPARASWTAKSSTATSFATAELPAPPRVVVPATATTDVPVSWTAAAGSSETTGYYVTRISGSGSADPACASDSAALLLETSCTDSGVPDGTYRYQVIAVHLSWTSLAADSDVVVVSATTTAPANEQQSPGLVGADDDGEAAAAPAEPELATVPVPDQSGSAAMTPTDGLAEPTADEAIPAVADPPAPEPPPGPGQPTSQAAPVPATAAVAPASAGSNPPEIDAPADAPSAEASGN